MTVLLEATSGRLILRGTDGVTRFDSNDKLFQATTRATGSVSRGPWTATRTTSGASSVDVETNTFLQSVNAACDAVVGSFRLTSVGSPAHGVGGLGWFNAGGSYLHYQQNGGNTAWGLVAFTFFCSGGGLYLKERVILSAFTPTNPGVTNTHQVLGLTFDYNLYCGSFV